MKFTPWLIASLSGLSTIHAQNSNSSAAPRKLPATIVEASRDRATPTAPTPESSRKELAKTPGGTEVVEAERYLQGRASTVADTFALSPGVFAQSRFGSDEARLSIRGSGIQRTFHGRGIRVMQDGVPLNLADGGFDFQALDPLATSHIDVWRGANALAYGSSTLGGAINYHSRTGRTNPGIFSRLEAASKPAPTAICAAPSPAATSKAHRMPTAPSRISPKTDSVTTRNKATSACSRISANN